MTNMKKSLQIKQNRQKHKNSKRIQKLKHQNIKWNISHEKSENIEIKNKEERIDIKHDKHKKQQTGQTWDIKNDQ